MNLAFYGTGSIAERHIDAIRRAGRLNITWLVSRTRTNAEALALKKGIQRFTDQEDAPLRDSSVDAVVIAYPTARHADLALAAFAAGKHVICEKPLTNDAAAAEQLVRSRPADRLLLVTQIRRFWPVYERVAQFVRNGEAGRLCRISISFETEWNWEGRTWRIEDAGGYFLDMHVHDVDLLLWWGRQRPHRVLGLGKNRADREGTVLFDFGEWYASLDFCGRVSGRSYPTDALTRYELILERGRVEVTVSSEVDARFIVAGDTIEHVHSPIADQLRASWDGLWSAQARALLGETAPPIPVDDAVANVAASMAAVRALEASRVQDLS